MHTLRAFLASQELLLLFIVIASGLLLGRLAIGGVRLGTAGVLFTGIALSACLELPSSSFEVAPLLKDFGLVLFVYCVGLTSGPGFFSAWRKREALRLNAVVATALGCGALVAVFGGKLFGLDRGYIAGVFCGALTNTPALAAVSDRLAGTALDTQPTLAYSVSYPFGVLGALLVLRWFGRARRGQLQREHQDLAWARKDIETANLEVREQRAVGKSIGELRVRDAAGVVISRLRRGDDIVVPTKYTVLAAGDVVTVVGSSAAIQAAIALLGQPSQERLEARRDRVDMRRVLVSKREHAGRLLADLDLARRFSAQVTRVRRMDIDLIPADDLRLALGDRLRVVAPVERLPEIGALFGDSERELAEIDYLALALGLCAGLVLARLPLPFSDARVSLGTAGGPLLVALILGRLGRSRSLVWSMPYEANHTLRELGLLLFLAAVGVGAGGQLSAVLNQKGLFLVGLGMLVTLITTGLALSLMQRWARASVIWSLGGSSGLQTQPATLAAAFELSEHADETYVAYALVYPVAMIGKILLAQAIASWA